jgi:hypothetical protein
MSPSIQVRPRPVSGRPLFDLGAKIDNGGRSTFIYKMLELARRDASDLQLAE